MEQVLSFLRKRINEMKALMTYMTITFMLLFAAGDLLANAAQDEGKLSRREKRAAKHEQLFERNRQMIESRSFVLETDFLQNRYGYRVPVSRNINFVMVDGDRAVIQIGSNTAVGPNGVGGVTAKGKITKWELKENERSKTFNLRMNVMTAMGTYDLSLLINNNHANARLTGTRPGNLLFSGDVVALEESVVYEGRSL